VQQTLKLDPDLVTMDIHMPGIDGFEATRQIMAQAPKPIVIISASVDPGEVKLSFQALAAGALAIVAKPSGPGSPTFKAEADEIIRIVKLMAEVKVVGRRGFSRLPKAPVVKISTAQPVELIAIGASTGGPAALWTILNGLPADLPVPILIVQHIAEGFDRGLADWLAGSTKLKVDLAQHGQPLSAGQVLIGPRGKHIGVSETRRIVLDQLTDPIGGFQPSATYLFQSVAKVYGGRALGVILTGMGNDGAQGLAALHKAGGRVIAQDKASSIVFGMPEAAVALGAVDQTLPLKEIAGVLGKLW
jgi:two-component system chemotaxis response regulator CheB